MTKQEFLDSLKDFSPDFPKEALMEIQSNRADFIPELLDSLDYAHRNAKELCESNSDYFLHTYAMYLLAEFREKQAVSASLPTSPWTRSGGYRWRLTKE